MKRYPKSIRKFIRRQKARIRASDPQGAEKRIRELLEEISKQYK